MGGLEEAVVSAGYWATKFSGGCHAFWGFLAAPVEPAGPTPKACAPRGDTCFRGGTRQFNRGCEETPKSMAPPPENLDAPYDLRSQGSGCENRFGRVQLSVALPALPIDRNEYGDH